MEVWKNIKGYEGLYQVSNTGNVKNVKTGTVLKQSYTSKKYKCCCLRNSGKQTVKVTHRLVAEVFIPNPDRLPQVNHIDEDKCNNNVENLEWCTNDYNAHYGNKIIRCAKSHEKSVIQYDLNGNIIRSWESIKSAADGLNICASHITECCKGKLNKTGNYKWSYQK